MEVVLRDRQDAHSTGTCRVKCVFVKRVFETFAKRVFVKRV